MKLTQIHTDILRGATEWTNAASLAAVSGKNASSTHTRLSNLMDAGYLAQRGTRKRVASGRFCYRVYKITGAGMKALETYYAPEPVKPVTSVVVARHPWELLGASRRPDWGAPTLREQALSPRFQNTPDNF